MNEGSRPPNIGAWLQHVSQRLAANGYRPMKPEVYQPMGYLFGTSFSGFELSKFGMVERFFLFAEIPDLDAANLQAFSAASFQFANKNKTVPLPNGLFTCTHCFAVAVTSNVDPQLAQMLKDSSPIMHWAAFEMPIIFDLTTGRLIHYQKTPIWGSAYHAGFRREVQKNLG